LKWQGGTIYDVSESTGLSVDVILTTENIEIEIQAALW